jgi:iron complex transport system ATP-binding protein
MIDRAMERTGILDLDERPFHSLSGGEQQLVLIARAIATECDTLVLDEPFTGLDLENQCLTLSLLQRLATDDGLGVVFAAHQPDHLYAVADQALVLQKGSRAVQGSVLELLTSELLSQVYGVEVRVLDLEREVGTSRHAVPHLHENTPRDAPGV